LWARIQRASHEVNTLLGLGFDFLEQFFGREHGRIFVRTLSGISWSNGDRFLLSLRRLQGRGGLIAYEQI
jgi:hypothetical protein